MDAGLIADRVRDIATDFGHQRAERQYRRELDRADFTRLGQAGFLLTGVSVEHGGIWDTPQRSTRLVVDMLRALAHADSSLALVASMHPAVLLSTGVIGFHDAPAPFRDSWERQRLWITDTIHSGHWWGTLFSEPGSGGDTNRVKAVAQPCQEGTGFRLTGVKHFGSGSGIMSYMMTSAVPTGETEPDDFFLNLQGSPWDDSAGIQLLAEWDGHGMIATQSHTFGFTDFPATRIAWPKTSRNSFGHHGASVHCFWTGVVAGILEIALETARQHLEKRLATWRAFEQVEWSRAEVEGWLVQQALEGMLRAVEQEGRLEAKHAVLMGKLAIAELAESAMGRLCRIVGGSAYSQHSPFGRWFEDVRALGFLRPPWGLAYDTLFEHSHGSTE